MAGRERGGSADPRGYLNKGRGEEDINQVGRCGEGGKGKKGGVKPMKQSYYLSNMSAAGFCRVQQLCSLRVNVLSPPHDLSAPLCRRHVRPSPPDCWNLSSD